MNDLKNIDKFEMVGELLLDLASQASDGSLVVIRSDDERLNGLSISEVENIIRVIGEESGLYDGFKLYENGHNGVVSFSKISLMIDSLSLRDYLIDLYGKKDTKTIPELQQEYLDNKILFWISLDKNETIIINDKYKTPRFHYSSLPYKVFQFLFNNEQKEYSKSEIEKSIGEEIQVRLPNLFDNKGFRGELKKLFFKSSNDKVLLRKKITGAEFKSLGIDKNKLELELNKFKKIT